MPVLYGETFYAFRLYLRGDARYDKTHFAETVRSAEIYPTRRPASRSLARVERFERFCLFFFFSNFSKFQIFRKCHFVRLVEAVDPSEDRRALGSRRRGLFGKFHFSRRFSTFEMKVYMIFFRNFPFLKCTSTEPEDAFDSASDRNAIPSPCRVFILGFVKSFGFFFF